MRGTQDAQFLVGLAYERRWLAALLHPVFMEVVKRPEDLTSITGPCPCPDPGPLLPM